MQRTLTFAQVRKLDVCGEKLRLERAMNQTNNRQGVAGADTSGQKERGGLVPSCPPASSGSP